MVARGRCVLCGAVLDKSWDWCPYCTPQSGEQPIAQLPPGWLVVLSEPGTEQLHGLSPYRRNLIGNDPKCQIRVCDEFVSAVHAAVEVSKGAWVLADCSSTNGTYVGTRQVKKTRLADGDVIGVGRARLCFKAVGVSPDPDSQSQVMASSVRLAWLASVADRSRIESFPLRSVQTVIGSGAGVDVHVPGNFVSAQHAEVVLASNGFELRDLGARNGTFVNGERIVRRLLADDDRVRLGDAELVFKVARA